MQTQSQAGGSRLGEDGVANPVLHHVNLKTSRLDEMIEWYGVVAGMRPNFRNDEVAFLTNDAANHRLALSGFPGIRDDADKVPHAGIHHTAFEFGSMEDLLTRYETLKAKDIVPHMCLDHGLTMSFYYLDPDGNSVEMQSDNFGDWDASSEWTRTSPDFAADPIGRFVDPDLIVAAWHDGASADELHRRAFAGEFVPEERPDLRIPIA